MGSLVRRWGRAVLVYSGLDAGVKSAGPQPQQPRRAEFQESGRLSQFRQNLCYPQLIRNMAKPVPYSVVKTACGGSFQSGVK